MTSNPVCLVCGRERKEGEPDYTPMNVILGGLAGWYSGDDGEICSDDMASIINQQ